MAFLARLLQASEQPADIIAAYPHLSPVAVYAALSSDLDHREAIECHLAQTTPEVLAGEYGFSVGEPGKVRFGRDQERR